MTELDGTPVSRRDSPAGIAFTERRPSHQQLLVTGYDGVRHEVEATAYPLLGAHDELHGVVVVFWEGTARRRFRLMLARVWGCRGSLATPGEDTVRYGGNTSCVEVRLESGHVLVLDAGTGMRPLGTALGPRRRRPSSTSSSRISISITSRGWASSNRCSNPASTCTSGDRRRRCRRWPSESRSTSRRRCSRCGSPMSPRNVTFHDAPEDGAHDRVGRDPSRPRDAPGPDGRVSHRGGRPVARLPARPRAGHRRESRDPAGRTG